MTNCLGGEWDCATYSHTLYHGLLWLAVPNLAKRIFDSHRAQPFAHVAYQENAVAWIIHIFEGTWMVDFIRIILFTFAVLQRKCIAKNFVHQIFAANDGTRKETSKCDSQPAKFPLILKMPALWSNIILGNRLISLSFAIFWCGDLGRSSIASAKTLTFYPSSTFISSRHLSKNPPLRDLSCNPSRSNR